MIHAMVHELLIQVITNSVFNQPSEPVKCLGWSNWIYHWYQINDICNGSRYIEHFVKWSTRFNRQPGYIVCFSLKWVVHLNCQVEDPFNDYWCIENTMTCSTVEPTNNVEWSVRVTIFADSWTAYVQRCSLNILLFSSWTTIISIASYFTGIVKNL